MNRQGDIILSKVSSLPEGLKKGSNTLAYGEITGHHHTILPMNKKSEVITVRGLDKMFVQVKNGRAVLVHTDEKKLDTNSIDDVIQKITTRISKGEDFHKPQILEKGIYEVKFEQEVNPFTKVLQRSVD